MIGYVEKGPVEKARWGLKRAAELYVAKQLSEGFTKDSSALLEGAAMEYVAAVRAEAKAKKARRK